MRQDRVRTWFCHAVMLCQQCWVGNFVSLPLWVTVCVNAFQDRMHLIGLGSYLRPSGTGLGMADLKPSDQVWVWYPFRPWKALSSQLCDWLLVQKMELCCISLFLIHQFGIYTLQSLLLKDYYWWYTNKWKKKNTEKCSGNSIMRITAVDNCFVNYLYGTQCYPFAISSQFYSYG